MAKLVIQIPCYNEEETLPRTLSDLPREVPGFDSVAWLVIDDGSTDRTSQVARAWGVDHIVRHPCNRGLARAFSAGVEASLALGADVIVNTDADNQYWGRDVSRLVQPILSGRADMVIGDRQTSQVPHFSVGKKLLQAVGSSVVRRLSKTDVPDAVSGFRAFSREAALQLNVVSSFSYTIETIIQAGRKQLAVASVPVRTNGKTRESRLFRSVPQFMRRSLVTMVRVYAMYYPLRTFVYISLALGVAGIVPVARFLYFYVIDGGQGHVQSLVLGGVLLVMGSVALLVGLVADLIAVNRRLLEITLEKLRRAELSGVSSREVSSLDSTQAWHE